MSNIKVKTQEELNQAYFNELKKLKSEDLVKKRMKKYVEMGVYND